VYLLDTNICIYLIKESPARVIRTLQSKRPDEITISSVTFAELQFGVEKSRQAVKNQKALDRFLAPLEIRPFDVEAGRVYARIRADLQRRRKIIGALDMMIGAHAIALNAILVTNNVREFKRIRGIEIENWTR